METDFKIWNKYFEDKISIAREKLEITFPLKEQQLGTLQQVYEGKDCISVLPTGYEVIGSVARMAE
jgi:hypothetical protein